MNIQYTHQVEKIGRLDDKAAVLPLQISKSIEMLLIHCIDSNIKSISIVTGKLQNNKLHPNRSPKSHPLHQLYINGILNIFRKHESYTSGRLLRAAGSNDVLDGE